MSMYEAFRDHGSAVFRPDMSTITLSTQGLSAAESGRAVCSSRSSTGRQYAPSAAVSHSLSMPPNAGLDSHTAGSSAAADVARHEGCTSAEAVNGQMSPGNTASNRGHDRWPPDIQWRPDNPLVRPCFFAGDCESAYTDKSCRTANVQIIGGPGPSSSLLTACWCAMLACSCTQCCTDASSKAEYCWHCGRGIQRF